MASAPLPNIVFVTVDAFRPDRAEGDAPVCPFLSEFSRSALRASATYASAPSTIGSFIEIMTSSPPGNEPGFDWGIFERPKSLPDHLATWGYETNLWSTIGWVTPTFGYGAHSNTRFFFDLRKAVSVLDKVLSPYFKRWDELSAPSRSQIRTRLLNLLAGFFETGSKVLTEQGQRDAVTGGGRRSTRKAMATFERERSDFHSDQTLYVEKVILRKFNGQSALPREVSLLQRTTHAVVGGFLSALIGRESLIARSYSSRKSPSAGAAVLVDEILNLLTGVQPGRPTFIWTHIFNCHLPYAGGSGSNWKQTAREWLARNGRALASPLSLAWKRRPTTEQEWRDWRSLYDSAAAHVDAQLERLYDCITAVSPDTLFVVASDHGEELGEHGDRSHTFRLYEHNARVLMLFKHRSHRAEIPGFAMLSDAAPTICGLIGLPKAKGWIGRDLSSLDILPEQVRLESYYGTPSTPELQQPYQARRDGNWKLLHTPQIHPDDRYSRAGSQLFDLSNDPDEQYDMSVGCARRANAVDAPDVGNAIAMIEGIHLLCTLGPASWSKEVVQGLEKAGATLFRINMSHTAVEDLEQLISKVRRWTSVPLCVDTEGAQIRTSDETIGDFFAGDYVQLRPDHAGKFLGLHPLQTVDELQVGDRLHVDFGGAEIEIVSAGTGEVLGRVLKPGFVGRNKGVETSRRLAERLPALSVKDHAAIEIGNRLGIGHYALSFAKNAAAVRELRSLVRASAHITAKIETLSAVREAHEIGLEADALLIDRGDLSRQIELPAIPLAQRHIIEAGTRAHKPVFVATNLVETMITGPAPTRAEANDIYSSLECGARGLVLAAETAIGHDPVGCARFVGDVIRIWTKRKAINFA